MSNLEKYNNAFVDSLGVNVEDLESLKYQEVAEWDSVGHMSLVSAIEETFEIMFDTEDIIDLSSYQVGKEIMKKYDIEL